MTSKREQKLALIRTAAYHNDQAAALRIYLDARISYETYEREWLQGRRLREAGMKCSCPECAKRM